MPSGAGRPVLCRQQAASKAQPDGPARGGDGGITKPYKFIGFGAMDVTKPYKFIGFGAMAVTKPYKFIGFRSS